MTDRFPDFVNPAVDVNGNTISGARLFFYRVGTSAKKDTYSNSAKSTPNTNPVVALGDGRFGDIFMLTDEQYKVILADDGVDDPPTTPIKTWDNVSPVRTNPVADIDVIAKSANFNVLTTEKGSLYEVDASSGGVVATLPLLADVGVGFPVRVKKTDSSTNLAQCDGNGAETVDGASTFDLDTQFDSVHLVSAAGEWRVASTHRPEVSDTPLPVGYINGFAATINVTNADHDIDLATGSCRDDADSENINLPSALVKQIDSPWAVGTNQGGLDTGTVAADTLYYLWAIKRTDTDVEDVLISASATAPTMPTNYDKKRLFAVAETDASSNLLRVYGRGETLQRLYIQDGAVATGTTTTPLDDTSPQITEGDQYLSAKFTARSAASTLRFEVTLFGSASVGANVAVALHRVGVNDALSVGPREFSQAGALKDVSFVHEMTAPDAAEQEYTVRAGMQSAGTFTFNGSSGAGRFNGLIASTLIITELTP